MTESVDTLTMNQKYVLIFDFCSSTSIMENLILLEKQERWRKLLIDIKKFLKGERATHGFEIYKFTGDGWILLFDIDFPPKELFSFLKRLCDRYKSSYKKNIREILSTTIDNIGITFGLDKGSLMRVVMDGHPEYIGRPLNIATRLQGAIKDKDLDPPGKVLMSKIVYDDVRRIISEDYRVRPVKRNLRNISGGDRYRAIELMLYENS